MNNNLSGGIISALRGVKRGVRICRDGFLVGLWGLMLRRRPISKNKIVFANFLGKGFGDNPKYIALELLRRDADLDLVWVTKNTGEALPEGIRAVRYGSFAAAREWATAALWVDNVRNTLRPRKRTEQIYLQAWHAPFSGKRVENDAEDMLSRDYVRHARYDGSVADGFIADSAAQEAQIKRAFWISEHTEVLPCGMPRNDYLLRNAHRRSELRQQYSISDSDCCILYAPTFRDDGSTDCYELDTEAVLDAFRALTGRECRLIVRLHPNVSAREDLFRYSGHIINGTRYSDAQELAVMCDFIISDYSSCVFDFMLLDKPAFVYVPDLEDYERSRGLLDEFYSLPFPRSQSVDELIAAVKAFDRSGYDEAVRRYREEYPTYSDGHSSELAADWILERLARTSES